MKTGFHVLLAHLRDDRSGLGVVAAVDNRIGVRPLDLLDDGGVVDGARGHPLEEDNGGLPRRLDEFFRVLGKTLPVIPFVMENRNLLEFQRTDREIHLQAGLGVIGGDGPVEVGVLAALGQFGICGRWGDDDELGVLVDAEGRLGRPAADVADDGGGVLGCQLGCRVRGHFRFADVIFHEELNRFPQDAPFSVDLLDDHLGGLDRRKAVRGEIAAVRPGHPQPDCVRSKKGSRRKGCEKCGKDNRQTRCGKRPVLHKHSPLL